MKSQDSLSNAMLENIASTPAMSPTELVKLAEHINFSFSHAERNDVQLAKNRIQIFAHALLGAANKM